MMPESKDTRYFHSYKSLFRINYRIHDIGGYVLPRAIPLDALFLTLIIYLPLLPLGWLIKPAHPFWATWFLAAGGAWLFSQADPQGKFLPVFILDIVNYLFRPKTTNLFGRQVHRAKRHRLDWDVVEVL